MKLRQFMALFLGLTLVLVTTPNVADYFSEASWTWSNDLTAGDYYDWQIEVYVNGSPAEGPQDFAIEDNNGNEHSLLHDTWFSLEIFQNPNGFDRNTMTLADFNGLFGMWYDNGTESIPMNVTEFVPIFAYPTNLNYGNGTVLNAFDVLIEEDLTIEFFSYANTSYIEDGLYHTSQEEYDTFDNYYDRTDIVFDYTTGLLDYYSFYQEYDDSTLEFKIIGVDNEDDDFPLDMVSFSDNLDIGDIFTWDVVEYRNDGITINETDDDMIIANGTVIEIEVIGEAENFDFTDETSDPNDFFKFSIDGDILNIQEIFDGPDDFFQFIFPIDIEINDTIFNFFELIAAGEEFDLDEDTVVSLEDGVFTLTESYSDEYGSDMRVMSWDANNGVMISMEQFFEWTYEVDGVNVTENDNLVIQRRGVDVTTGTDTETNTETVTDTVDTSTNSTGDSSSTETPALDLPFAAPIWFSFALLAIPVIRRSKNQ